MILWYYYSWVANWVVKGLARYILLNDKINIP